jgi:fused signal recognition particle receptor
MILKFLKSGVEKLQSALSKTRTALSQKIMGLFKGKVDEAALEKLEELLFEADLGVKTAVSLTDKVRQLAKDKEEVSAETLHQILKDEILQILNEQEPTLQESPDACEPTVILVVGVNGSGKTTSIAKLVRVLQDEGKKVLIGAGDTFRAAAIDQLDMWATKLGCDIVKSSPNADPAAVAFDAISAGKSRGADIVIIDTAGRLHTKTHLMQELDKIQRVCKKVCPSAPHETLLVLDASIGQNAIDQAKTFNSFTPVTGLILSKLDGTAKGGIAIAIQRELKVPIKFIGTGETMNDLAPFNATEFVEALFN